jgi:DNA topoisomerase-1
VEILATEGKKSGTQVLKELGIDPKTQLAIEIKDGRYGAYVTDGKINVTLPKGSDINGLTLETAIQLIADKKAKGPTKKRRFNKRKASA